MRSAKRKTNSNLHILFIIFIITLVALPIFLTFASDDEITMSATLYDTSSYSGTGTELTTSGATVKGWNYTDSKYLNISPTVKDDGNTYAVQVSLPKEFYIVASDIKESLPAGFSKVDFTKNSDVSVNGGNGKYSPNTYSGTAIYTINKGTTTATLQLQIKYDENLWNRMENDLLTYNGEKPIDVKLLKLESDGSYSEVKDISIGKAYSKNKFEYVSETHIYNENTQLGRNADNVTVAKGMNVNVTVPFVSKDRSSQAYFYKKFRIEIVLPKYTGKDGKVTYLNVSQIKYVGNQSYGSPRYTIDTSKAKTDGRVYINFEDIMFRNSDSLIKYYFDLSDDLDNLGVDSIKFSQLRTIFSATNGSGNYVELLTSWGANITYNAVKKEDVRGSVTTYRQTVKDIPQEVKDDKGNITRYGSVTQLGKVTIRNYGTGDSEKKTIKITFDSDNSGKVGVTGINLPITKESITLKYTLVDENGKQVYLDSNGNQVDSTASGAISEWTLQNANTDKSITWQIYRMQLPEKQQKYFFKTMEYNATTIPANTNIYSGNSYGARETFYGYVRLNENEANYTGIKTKLEIISEHPDKIPTITSVCTHSFTAISGMVVGIDKVTVNGKQGTNTELNSGESAKITGSIYCLADSYSDSALWARDLILGVVVPDGVTLNPEDISFTTKYVKNSTTKPYKIDGPVKLSNGNNLYRIYLPKDIIIGYLSEKFTALPGKSDDTDKDRVDFSFSINTDSTMNQQTFYLKQSIFVASSTQKVNEYWGAYRSTGMQDYNDVNGNGSTSDYVGAINTSNYIEVKPQLAEFDINDDVSTTVGTTTSESSEAVNLTSKDDIVNYKVTLDCENGGSADKFAYYIPIPKANSKTDDYMIKSTENGFETKLQSAVEVTDENLYNIWYTTDKNLNYTTVGADTVKWYTADEMTSKGLNYTDVTMIKIKAKHEPIINGSKTEITLKLKYAGNSYNEDAGKSYTWHSAGSYEYIVGNRITSGTFNTNGVTVNLTYSKNMDDKTLTAAVNMKPTKSGGVNTITTNASDLPTFNLAKSYKITDVKTYNITLKTKDYINNNLGMDGVYANEQFGVTVAVNNGDAVDILSTASEDKPIAVGSGIANTATTFTYKLYNANLLSDDVTDRYIIVTLVGDNGVTIKQKIKINVELPIAENPESAIVAGKRYTTFSETTKSVGITKDSSSTSQFVLNYAPNLYSNKKLKFSSKLPVGTNIILLDKIGDNNFTYWYYKVAKEVSDINISDFIKMGSTTEKYQGDNSSLEVKETTLAIIDFANSTSAPAENYAINLVLEGANSNISNVESDQLNLATASQRTFALSADKNSQNFGDTFTINYTLGDITNVESIYSGRKMALVLTPKTTIPKDTYINYNNEKYYHNSENKFILPLDNVQNGSGSAAFTVNSNMCGKGASKYSFGVELWVSATSNANMPIAGSKKAETSITVNNTKKPDPSFAVTGMNSRILTHDDLQNTGTISFKFKQDSKCTVCLQLMKKVGNGYSKVTDKLNSVNGNTTHKLGVFDVDASSGSNTIKYKLASTTEVGTYRFVFIVKDSNGNELMEIPYNFIVTDK